MIARQTGWPRRWLMTDERIGERLWDAIGRLPRGDGGIVFRHYATDPAERARLGKRIAEYCRTHVLKLAVAGADLAREVGADLIHNPAGLTADRPFSCSVHDLGEAHAARDSGAALVFVSPVFATRSHPGRAPLGIDKAKALALAAGVPAIALGGMDEEKFADFEKARFHGWAGIDAWVRGPSRE